MSVPNDNEIIMLDGGDEWVNPLGALAPCNGCKHYLKAYTCNAFPDGIPQVILDGTNRHTKPYPGDHDIQFEPA